MAMRVDVMKTPNRRNLAPMQTRTIYEYTRTELAPEYGYPWARTVLAYLEEHSNVDSAQQRVALKTIRKILLLNHNQQAFGPMDTLLYMHCLYMTMRTIVRRLESVGIVRTLSDSFTDWLLRKGNVRRVMSMHRARRTFKENIIASAVDALQLPPIFANMFVSKIVTDETGSWIDADMLPNDALLDTIQATDVVVPHHTAERSRGPRSLCPRSCTPETLRKLRQSDLLLAAMDPDVLQSNDGIQAAAASIRLYDEKVAHIQRAAPRPYQPPVGSTDEFEWRLEYLTSQRALALSSVILPHITSHHNMLEFEVMRGGIVTVMRDVLITAEAVGECFARCADVASSVQFRSVDRVSEARIILQAICKDTVDVIGTINRRLGASNIRLASRSPWCIDALLEPYESEFWYAEDMLNITCILLQTMITGETIAAYEHLNMLMSAARAYCSGYPAISTARNTWNRVYRRMEHVQGFNHIMNHMDMAWSSSRYDRKLYSRSRDVVWSCTTLVTEMFVRLEVNLVDKLLKDDTIQLSGFSPYTALYSSDYLRAVPWWITSAGVWYDVPLDLDRNMHCSLAEIAQTNKCAVHRELAVIAGVATWVPTMVSLVAPTEVMRTIMMFAAYHRKRASDAMVTHLMNALVPIEKQSVGLRPLLLRLVVTPSRYVADFPNDNEVSYAMKSITAYKASNNEFTSSRMRPATFGHDPCRRRRGLSVDVLVLKCYVLPKGRESEATPTTDVVLDVQCSANLPVSVLLICEAYQKSASGTTERYPTYGESTLNCALVPEFDGRLVVSY